MRKRIQSLVIPPAWTRVWIAPSPNSHIQATGRDSRGRKQYIYHTRWREERDAAKFDRMGQFGRTLPRIRERVAEDLRSRGLGPKRVTAAAIHILDQASIRVGNDQYARDNGTFGLTTLRPEHVEVAGTTVQLEFAGKGGKALSAQIRDARVARIVRACGELPGQELFHYVDDDNEVRRIRSENINEYIREAAGGDFSAKDFRTWAASVLAAAMLADADVPESEAAQKRIVVAVVRDVADRLGNTPAVCRECYIHPHVLLSFDDGTLQAAWKRNRSRWCSGDREPGESLLLWVLSKWKLKATRGVQGTKLSDDPVRIPTS